MSVLRFARKPRTMKPWPANLPPPVYASDTRNKELAVSALCSLIMRDGSRLYCSDLTNDQAADVARWATSTKEI